MSFATGIVAFISTRRKCQVNVFVIIGMVRQIAMRPPSIDGSRALFVQLFQAFQEEKIGDLLCVIHECKPIVPKDMSVIPDFLDESTSSG